MPATPRARRKILTSAIWLALSPFAIACTFALVSRSTLRESLALLVIMGIIGIALPVVIVPKASRSWRGYQVLLSDEHIERQMPGYSAVELERTQVQAIKETPGLGLSVRGLSRQGTVFVPVGMEGYDEIRDHLSQWRAITTTPRRFVLQLALPAAMIGMIGLGAGTYATDEPRIAVPCSILFAVVLCWLAHLVRTRPAFKDNLKGYWWFMLLMAAGALYRAYALIAS